MLPILDDSQRDTAHANGLALLETYRHATERARKNHAQAMKVTPGGATQNRLLERADMWDERADAAYVALVAIFKGQP